MRRIHEEIEKVAYSVKWLLEDLKHEGLENRVSNMIDETGLEDVCCSLNTDWSIFEMEMYEQGMDALNCGDDIELLNLLVSYKNEMEGILN